MMINSNNMVSITEANQNFSKVARMVDETGSAIVMKNNVPKYLILEFDQIEKEEAANTEEVMAVARRMLSKHKAAFEELAH